MSTAGAQFAQWLGEVHPGLYDTLHSYVAQRLNAVRAGRATLRGFGDDSDGITTTFDDSGDSFTDGSDSSIVSSYTPLTVDIPTLSASDLSDPGFSTSFPSVDTTSLATTSDSSGSSFLDSLSSGIQSAASGVANFLTSTDGLTAVAKLATAYFQVQNTKANAQLQTAVLQAQATRAATGQSPYPISYITGANGQIIPVYSAEYGSIAGLPVALQNAIATGQAQYVSSDGVSGYTVPANVASSLNSNVNLTSLLPWIALLVGGLILARELK